MFDRIFNEIFGDVDFKQFFENLGEEKEEKENGHSYYHRVEDKYDNGKHVSHVEKEIKDGEVIKDIKDIFKIEDKKEEKAIEEKKEENNNEKYSAYYEQRLKKASDLLEEAQKTIFNQQKQIESYENRCKELEVKFDKLRDLL